MIKAHQRSRLVAAQARAVSRHKCEYLQRNVNTSSESYLDPPAVVSRGAGGAVGEERSIEMMRFPFRFHCFSNINDPGSSAVKTHRCSSL